MRTDKLHPWDSAEHLKDEQDIALYLQATLEEGSDDSAFIAHTLDIFARARAMTPLAKEAGLGRESLYKALSGNGNPSLTTIHKLAKGEGFKLQLQSVSR